MLKTAVAIRHLAFEDLGCFGPVLERAGYKVHYYDAGVDELWTLDPLTTGLIVVLGGPIGAYEEEKYPFLTEELQLIERRLASGKPIFGVCLGAQLMARVLGAKVYPGPAKEIGFSELTLTEAGRRSCLNVFEGGPVLHWHGDRFDLPEGAEALASTEICPVQAFSYGSNAFGAQFHPEAGGEGFERWLIGHTIELGAAGVDVPRLRADNEHWGPILKPRAEACLETWLRNLDA
ncbi:glutamine amidotransferase [Tistrella mobilis]|uniref:glutamine amidotransferase n=1 Tax=Tistrella mobilis TaxID=171437 RepID=UPI00355852C5